MPDRDFYYLIGLRYELGENQVEHSFWADGLDGEREIWENCLRTLKMVGNAQLVHYGAYETRFLRQMKKRYISASEDIDFIDRLIESSINLIDSIYGKIYFPTYSNSLKDVARYLGFKWTWPQVTGAATPLLRKVWELSPKEESKDLLICYNMDDCKAAAVVAETLVHLCKGKQSELNSVDVGSLEVSFQRTFGKFDSILPEFKKINDAAYWDYQRSKIFIRTDKAVQRSVHRSQRIQNKLPVDKEIIVEDRPEKCPSALRLKFGNIRQEGRMSFMI